MASIIYGSECSTDRSGTGSSYYNIKYFNNPATFTIILYCSIIPSMQLLQSPRRVAYSEILEGNLPRNALTSIVDQIIYTIPNVPQSNATVFTNAWGPTTSSGNSDHQILYQQHIQQQQLQETPHSRNQSQSAQSGLLSGRAHHNQNRFHSIPNSHIIWCTTHINIWTSLKLTRVAQISMKANI